MHDGRGPPRGGLKEAIEVFHDRYTLLRATCPEDFAASPDDGKPEASLIRATSYMPKPAEGRSLFRVYV
jgi:hypothetical protein